MAMESNLFSLKPPFNATLLSPVQRETLARVAPRLVSIPIMASASSFDVSFDFTDADGDVGLDSFVFWTYFFQPSGDFDFFDASPWTFIGSPSSGTVSLRTCFAFITNATMDITVSLTDDAGLTSNSLAVRVPRPAGAPAGAAHSPRRIARR